MRSYFLYSFFFILCNACPLLHFINSIFSLVSQMYYKIRTSRFQNTIPDHGAEIFNKYKRQPTFKQKISVPNYIINSTSSQQSHSQTEMTCCIISLYCNTSNLFAIYQIKSSQSSATLVYWHYSFHYYCNYAYTKLPMFIHVLIIKPLIQCD